MVMLLSSRKALNLEIADHDVNPILSMSLIAAVPFNVFDLVSVSHVESLLDDWWHIGLCG
jgi:hypothetical protein